MHKQFPLSCLRRRREDDLVAIFLVMVALLCTTACSKRKFTQETSSMTPSISPHEIVTADMRAYRSASPERWDVVVFDSPPAANMGRSSAPWVFRVVGLPGETIGIKDGEILVNTGLAAKPKQVVSVRYQPPVNTPGSSPVVFPFTIPAGEYLLLGDNPSNAFDGRYWGTLPSSAIKGRVIGK